MVCGAESIVTVTAEPVKKDEKPEAGKKGLPGYTFEHAAGALRLAAGGFGC